MTKWQSCTQVRVRSRRHGCEVESSESTETHSPDEAHRGWRMGNDSTRSSAMSDVFVVLFTFLAHFWLFIRKSDLHWLFASDSRSHLVSQVRLSRVRVWPVRLVCTTFECLLHLISLRPLQIFVYLEQCAFYRGSLLRRQYAANKLCTLNNDVCLITRFTVYHYQNNIHLLFSSSVLEVAHFSHLHTQK